MDAMLARAVCELTGEATVTEAWSRLFRHLNQARGKGDVGYRAGEQIAHQAELGGHDLPRGPRQPGDLHASSGGTIT